MELIITHDANNLILPIAYNSILQGIIYNNLSEKPELSRFIHNNGYSFNSRKTKGFTFSNIEGKFRIDNKKIIFNGLISLRIRSINPILINTIANSIRNNGINYCGQQYNDVSCEIKDESVEEDSIYIQMVSPICIYQTIDCKTIYYTPLDEEFYELLNDNFYRKYFSYFGIYPYSRINIIPIDVREKDKIVTKYKNFYIMGYKGVYKLEGERKYLDFLFQVGLGSKCSQGFGMFDIL